MVKKYFDGCYKIILILLALVWGYITFSSIFFPYNGPFNPLIIILGILLVIIFLCNIYRATTRLKEVNLDRVALAIFIIVFGIMFIFGLNYRIIPAYDLSHIILKSNQLLVNPHFGFDVYFSIYPNQIPLTFLVYGLKVLGMNIGFFNPEDFVIIYNALMSSLMLLIVYHILKHLFSRRTAIIGMVLMAIYPDFYLYVSYYYSDIVTLPFTLLGYLFLLRSEKKHALTNSLVAGILLAIAFKLRVVSFILVIAYFIMAWRKTRVKELLLRFGVFILGFFIVLMGYKMLVLKYDVAIDKNLEAPIYHWIMMGVNGDKQGGYTDDDINFTIHSLDKKHDILTTIKKRVHNLPPTFFFEKLSRVWSSGDHDILRKYNLVNNYRGIHNLFKGHLSIFVKYYDQILKATIYLLFWFSIIKDIFIKTSFIKGKNSTLFLCLFGAIIFYLFWEASPRYSFSFLPMIIISASSIIKYFTYPKFSELKKVPIKKIKKCLSVVIMFGLIIFLGLTFFKYSFKQHSLTYSRLVQNFSSNNYYPLISEQLKQSFIVRDDFNRFALYVDKSHLKEPLTYVFTIMDTKGNIITEGSYLFEPSLDNKANFKRATMVFDTIKVKNKEQFYFIFYCPKATKDNYIAVNIYEPSTQISNDKINPENFINGYDINPAGITYINDNIVNGELKMRVLHEYWGPIIPYPYFLLFSGVIILFAVINLLCWIKIVVKFDDDNAEKL